jgi:hypothetical protein
MTSSTRGISARISVITAAGLGACLLALPAWSQKFPNYPVTSEQKATAQKVGQAGVPLADLAPDAPDTYVVGRRHLVGHLKCTCAARGAGRNSGA